ncbi:hypothetical protein [Actinophytocola sp.]|uniref:hypothetical protein n=1 Tax=Actinophytocola sp. TaxID=1872138 RepID=UPI003D6AC5BB
MTYADELRARFRHAPVGPPQPPWRPLVAAPTAVAVGGLLGVGFATHPGDGVDLLLVASSQGRGLFDGATGERVARDPDPDFDYPDGQDLCCTGIGILAGVRVPLAGLFGGGLHRVTPDGWMLDIVTPDWPAERVVLSAPSQDPFGEPDRGGWQVIHDETVCELRAVGFSPTGTTLVIASSCDFIMFTRA